MITTVDCPTCGTKVEWIALNQFRPFCSHRCKQIDLGAWAAEEYAIPIVTPSNQIDDDDKSFQ